MLLAIDVGNTNITIGRMVDGEVAETWRLPSRPAESVGEVERALEGATQAVMVSVVPAVSTAVEEVLAGGGVSRLIADARTIPLSIRVDRPAEVGADRLVNAFAALRLYGAPIIVVDLGTATTFDVVDADGSFVGGAIVPGVRLGLEALASQTALLPSIEPVRPARAIGTDTVSAMQSGAVIGHIGAVRELLAEITAELAGEGGPVPKVVLTGGLSASGWAADIPGVDWIDPNLTLRGLALLHAEVSAAAPEPATA